MNVAEDLDGFTLFGSVPGHDPILSSSFLMISHERSSEFSGEPEEKEGTGDDDEDDHDDPIDALFARPVQDFLMREDSRKVPEAVGSGAEPPRSNSFATTATTSAAADADPSRDLSLSLSLTDSVMDLPPDLLSDCEDNDDNYKVGAVIKPDFMASNDLLGGYNCDHHHHPSPCAVSSSSTQEHKSRSSMMTRKRSREVTPSTTTRSSPSAATLDSSFVAAHDDDDHETIHKTTPFQRRLQRKSSSNSSSSSYSNQSNQSSNKKLRRTQSSSVASTPDNQVKHVRSIDVLFGKGGKINKHDGNLRYHHEKKQLQTEYLDPDTSKPRKRELVQVLYDIVVDWGGRFLRCENDCWYVAHREAALEKCRQALATPERSKEERAERRRLFLEKRKAKQRRSTR